MKRILQFGGRKGVKLIDESNDEYGIKHTSNEPHVLVKGSALPSGAATAAKQLADEHNVKVKGYTGTSNQYPRIDPSTFAIETIDYAHHEIHAGSFYCIHHYEADFDKDENFGILFTTPDNTKWLHMFSIVWSGAAALFEILETPTIDTGNYPTVFSTPINRNRNSDNTSGILSVRGTPVVNQASLKRPADTAPVTGDGTVIHAEMLGSSKQGGGGGGRDNNEYMLKQGTTYYFRLSGTAGGADNSVASILLNFYEHTDLE